MSYVGSPGGILCRWRMACRLLRRDAAKMWSGVNRKRIQRPEATQRAGRPND